MLQNAGQHYGFIFDLQTSRSANWGRLQRDLLLYGARSPQFRAHYPGRRAADNDRRGQFEGVITNLLRRYDEHADNADYRANIEKLLIQQTCPDCPGTGCGPRAAR